MAHLHTLASGNCGHVFNLSGAALRQCSPATGARKSSKCMAVATGVPTPPSIDDTSAAPISAVEHSKACLKDMNYEELESWCVDMGEKASRAMQLWRFMYYDGQWIRGFHETIGTQNGLSKSFADQADQASTCDAGLHLQHVHTSTDGTRKLLFSIAGEETAQVETVLIPVVRKQGKRNRITICVSSQVGCAMGCTFCYTGRMGLMRNLSAAQIVEQLVEARRLLHETGEAATATNIVFMGMGEPLNNYEAVMRAIQIATHPLGLHFSKNKVTLSTVGLVPQLRRFCRSGVPAQLAVSLHAPNDALRSTIVPVNRTHSLGLLTECLRQEFPREESPKWHGRHVLIEYVMLKGVNDKCEHARELLGLLEGIEAKINLIVFNPHEGTVYQASDTHTVEDFRHTLIQGGRVCTIRDSRGSSEMAACGQLGNPTLS
eukprot:jgi/Ulvmu1/11354/UM075_0014.1